MVRTFDDEVKALEDYGHDCCARIDDRIHECCERIREAHQNEFSQMLRIYEVAVEFMKGDADAVDARPSDAASADSPVLAPAGHMAGCACDQVSEVLAPVTQELRDSMRVYRKFSIDDGKEHVELDVETFGQLCDNIDAIHAGLERENVELQKRTKYPAETERVNMLEREVKRLTSECKTQRNNFDQATSAREHWKTLYEQALEQIHDLERDYKVACDVNERQDLEYAELAKRYDNTISLPLDKDGKVWRVGDELLDDGMVCEVVGIGPNRLYYYCEATDTVEWTQADSRRHYERKLAVVDVLDEMLQRFSEDSYEGYLEDFIAEYVDKLKLCDADA